MVVLHVIGAGVSGICFSKYLLEHDKDVQVYMYERSVNKIGCNCAWATHEKFRRLMQNNFGIDLSKYVLFKPVGLHVHSMKHAGRDFYIMSDSLYIIDKRKLLRDLIASCISTGRLKLIEAEVGSIRDMEKASGMSVKADDVLVCTGTFAPKYKTDEGCIPCYQARLQGNLAHGHHDGYLEIMVGKLGYAWAFPLNDVCSDWHVGAGDFFISPKDLTDKLIERIFSSYKFGCQCGMTYVKVIPPFMDRVILPVADDKGMNVSVGACGELAGNVTSLIGEGIYPSAYAGIECAKRYLDTGKIETKNLPLQADVHEIDLINYVLKHGKIGIKQISNIWKIYKNARSMGLKVKFMDSIRLIRAWR